MMYSRSEMGMRCNRCGNDHFEQYDIKDITVVPQSPRDGGGFLVYLRLHVDNGAVTVSLPCPCLQHWPALHTHALALARGTLL